VNVTPEKKKKKTNKSHVTTGLNQILIEKEINRYYIIFQSGGHAKEHSRV
jgi:hypothetical protein